MKSLISLIICAGMAAIGFVMPVSAADKTETISGNSYELDANSKYEFGLPGVSLSSVTAGSFTVSGSIGEKTVGDVAQYVVKDGLLSFTYTPNGTYKNTEEKQWHFAEDGSKDVIDNVLSDTIKMGAIVVQTSFDRNKYVKLNRRD